MIMLMAVAVAVFGAVSFAAAVTSIVLVLLKNLVMVWWSDIVAYIPPVRRKAY